MSDLSDQYYYGTQDAFDNTSDANASDYVIEQVLNRRVHAAVVKVQKVTNTPGQLAALGRVDVLPLVNQIDGRGRPTKHETVYSLCYYRLRGGRNAILCDPEVGDVGLAVICDRDISAVKAARDQANPGSGRRGNLADGIYFGVCLDGDAPNQYVRFLEGGLEVVDKNSNKIIMDEAGIQIIDKSNNKILMTSSGIDLNP